MNNKQPFTSKARVWGTPPSTSLRQRTIRQRTKLSSTVLIIGARLIVMSTRYLICGSVTDYAEDQRQTGRLRPGLCCIHTSARSVRLPYTITSSCPTPSRISSTWTLFHLFALELSILLPILFHHRSQVSLQLATVKAQQSQLIPQRVVSELVAA